DLGWADDLSALLDLADEHGAPDDRLLQAVESEVSSSDDAFVVYTSGSTAAPKAVVHGQGSVASQPAALAPYFLRTAEDRTMPLRPMFWLGCTAFALPSLATGSTLVYPPAPSIDGVLDTIEAPGVNSVTVWHLAAKLRAAAIERGLDIN